MDRITQTMDSGDSIIEQDRRFYEKQIAPMIHADFTAYEKRIAVGVVGEGSDCFGYDDEISRDHDFGIGVCLWITDDDAQCIGEQLQKRYQEMLFEWIHKNPEILSSPEILSKYLVQRRGVMTIRKFYETILGFRIDPANPTVNNAAWFYTDEWKFAAATNGIVFCDELGQFSSIRNAILQYYTEKVWRMRLTNELHEFSAAMQANYARCMARGDLIASNFCKTRSIDAAMNILFLLRRTFAPYYKWKFRAFRELDGSEELVLLLEEAVVMQPDLNHWKDYTYDPRRINTSDPLLMQFEQIAEILADCLYACGLINNHEQYLKAHCTSIASGIK